MPWSKPTPPSPFDVIGAAQPLLPIHCPQCGAPLAFTDSHALRCHCGAISISHAKMLVLAEQPGHELLDEIRAQFNKSLETNIVPTMKALVHFYGQSLPDVIPIWDVPPVSAPVFVKYEPFVPKPGKSVASMFLESTVGGDDPNFYKGPKTVPKEKVDFSKLTPALQEFFQDFVSANP